MTILGGWGEGAKVAPERRLELRKDWAKRHELVGSPDGCLNSYAYLRCLCTCVRECVIVFAYLLCSWGHRLPSVDTVHLNIQDRQQFLDLGSALALGLKMASGLPISKGAFEVCVTKVHADDDPFPPASRLFFLFFGCVRLRRNMPYPERAAQSPGIFTRKSFPIFRLCLAPKSIWGGVQKRSDSPHVTQKRTPPYEAEVDESNIRSTSRRMGPPKSQRRAEALRVPSSEGLEVGQRRWAESPIFGFLS